MHWYIENFRSNKNLGDGEKGHQASASELYGNTKGIKMKGHHFYQEVPMLLRSFMLIGLL